ncbi:23199_t:CDS:2 [Dentiscutata erythropus]|uniref:23199_t:CDS:1 n=1 Tax=Dentiscutata erythropus TaxID=1348616 RepID=A0A9N9CSR3_9GLOM|nr:23199_t:CDS:2 [Dentiscutata erythropus]
MNDTTTPKTDVEKEKKLFNEISSAIILPRSKNPTKTSETFRAFAG